MIFVTSYAFQKKHFYQIFPKKEDLVKKAVLEFQTSLVTEKFMKMYRNKNAIDALILIIKEVKLHAHNDCTSFNYDLEKYYPSLYNDYMKHKTDWMKESFMNNLRQGIEEGYYRGFRYRIKRHISCCSVKQFIQRYFESFTENSG